MPMIDVSVALTNPYTLDTFSVFRRAEAINAFGEVIPGSVQFTGVFGVVYPEGDEALERRPDVQLQAKHLVVITLFPLRAAAVDGQAQSWQPDLVVWNGNNYLCGELSDYSNYAAGFVKVGAAIFDSMPQPPIIGKFSGFFGGKLQNQPLTVLSSTQLSLGAAPLLQTLLLFRNGVLQQVPGDYTLTGNLINLVLPLGATDLVVAYA